MLKGAQKKMIVVRTKDSRLFEEAYFVMRKDTPESSRDSGDILWEANYPAPGTWAYLTETE